MLWVHVEQYGRTPALVLRQHSMGCTLRGGWREEYQVVNHWFPDPLTARQFAAERHYVPFPRWMTVLDDSAFNHRTLRATRRLNPIALYVMQGYMRQNLFIHAVKYLRLSTRQTLRDCKTVCDHIRDVLKHEELYATVPPPKPGALS